MIDKINRLKAEIDALKASKADEIEALRIKYLSKKGEISLLFNDFRNVAAENKKEVGKLLNELKEKALNRINELKENGTIIIFSSHQMKTLIAILKKTT